MKPEAIVHLDAAGRVESATEEACRMMGLPAEEILGSTFVDHIIDGHRARFDAEVQAILDASEEHGRADCIVVGRDGIGRLVTLLVTRGDEGRLLLEICVPERADQVPQVHTLSLAHPRRLLPVLIRLLAAYQRAPGREDTLRHGLDALREMTGAQAGALIEWAQPPRRGATLASSGAFDESCLVGVFRPPVLARLARGDVVLKEALTDGSNPDSSLVLVPLVSAAAPEAVAVLAIEGYHTLAVEEQLGLKAIGGVVGLALRVAAAGQDGAEEMPGGPEIESAVALGRLSAGLANEINNAATVLSGNLDQLAARRGRPVPGAVIESLAADSLQAVETIRDLTDALRAFAPEESWEDEEIDPQRVIEMVARAVRFYARRSIVIDIAPGRAPLPPVRCRSHHLIRSLFLFLVQLVEEAQASGRAIRVGLSAKASQGAAEIAVRVEAGALGPPAALLAQLEAGGLLHRHLDRAGARIVRSIDDNGVLSVTLSLPAAVEPRRSVPPPAAAPSGRRGTILVVDPDLAVIRSLRRVLSRRHDVLAASTGEEALQILESSPDVDLVICEVFLPGIGGPDLHRDLRERRHPAADRIAFMTGGAADAEVARFLAGTPLPILEKPLNIEVLKSLVSAMIP